MHLDGGDGLYGDFIRPAGEEADLRGDPEYTACEGGGIISIRLEVRFKVLRVGA